jgi:hypothetical protein
LPFAPRRVGAKLLRFGRASAAQCAFACARLSCLGESGRREQTRRQSDGGQLSCDPPSVSYAQAKRTKSSLSVASQRGWKRVAQIEQFRGAFSGSAIRRNGGLIRWHLRRLPKRYVD